MNVKKKDNVNPTSNTNELLLYHSRADPNYISKAATRLHKQPNRLTYLHLYAFIFQPAISPFE